MLVIDRVIFFLFVRHAPKSTLFPYTTLFRSQREHEHAAFGNRDLRASVNGGKPRIAATERPGRSEEHTSELQSRFDLVCRLLLEKKKQTPHKCRDVADL